MYAQKYSATWKKNKRINTPQPLFSGCIPLFNNLLEGNDKEDEIELEVSDKPANKDFTEVKKERREKNKPKWV